jgi:hypothetical protein
LGSISTTTTAFAISVVGLAVLVNVASKLTRSPRDTELAEEFVTACTIPVSPVALVVFCADADPLLASIYGWVVKQVVPLILTSIVNVCGFTSSLPQAPRVSHTAEILPATFAAPKGTPARLAVISPDKVPIIGDVSIAAHCLTAEGEG